MTPEKLLNALNDIDGQSIRVAHAEKQTARRRSSRRIAAVLAAVIALVAMTVTVFAAEDIASWFREYFSRETSENLTPEQIEYISENEQTIAETQTLNGYTLEVKTAMTDGNIAYIVLGVTGPEDAVLTRTEIEGYSSDAPSLSFGNRDTDFLTPTSGQKVWGSRNHGAVEDNDGRDNTQDILITLEPTYDEKDGNPLVPGSVWNLHIENLIAQYRNEAYIEEVHERYPGENILLPDEEGTKMYPEVVLAEGTWDFEITFEDSNTHTLELVTDPVTVEACTGFKADGTDVYKDVTVTSFELGSLSAAIRYELSYPAAVDFSDNNTRLIYVVMKDGSRVKLNSSFGQVGEVRMLAESPIILDNVDYVLMADGTKLMAP